MGDHCVDQSSASNDAVVVGGKVPVALQSSVQPAPAPVPAGCCDMTAAVVAVVACNLSTEESVSGHSYYHQVACWFGAALSASAGSAVSAGPV